MTFFLKSLSRRRTLLGTATALASLLFVAFACGSAVAQSRAVYFNQTPLDDEKLQALEQYYRVHIPDGSYWYDRYCGAWGFEGGPTRGFILPGLNLGGPMRADASHGRTGVFVNGRELHYLDVMALRQFMPVYRGHFWVDSEGNGGYVGGPALFNLKRLAEQARGRYPPDIDRRSGGRRSILTTWDLMHHW